MHKEIKDSGLGELLKIRTITPDMKLGQYLGKQVQYKRDLLTSEFIAKHGRIIVDEIFTIKEVQIDYQGTPCLRGYFDGDTFGRCINPEHIEEV